MGHEPNKSWAGRFEKIPAWIFSYGVWAQLSGREAKVLAVLCDLADNKTAISRATHRTIAGKAGVGVHSISAITKSLVMHDVVKKWRKGYRAYYQVLFEPPDWLIQTGIHFAPDKVPKKPRIYQRDESSGKFLQISSDDKSPKNIEEQLPKLSATL